MGDVRDSYVSLAPKKKKKAKPACIENDVGSSYLQERQAVGEYHRLVQELKLDSGRFYQYFRMTPEVFEILLSLVGPAIAKENTNYRQSIEPEQRLVICLRFLATGDSFTTIAFNYRLGSSTVRSIVLQTCGAIWDVLMPTFMKFPNGSDWKDIAKNFDEKWNFPNCIGAVDGKHVVLQAPPNSGSLFFNYKGTFSIVLMALVDADYKFLAVDIGAYGSNSDGGVFSNSNFGKRVLNDSLDYPDDKILPGAPNLGPQPFVFVGDEAFPLKRHLMRPFPGERRARLSPDKRIFNYRLSRARRTSENAFGLLAQRFRIFQRRIILLPDNAVIVTKAATVLHNFLECKKSDEGEAFEQNVERDEGFGLQRVANIGGNRASAEAFTVRAKFTEYFNSTEGMVPWQADTINRGLQANRH